MEITLNRKGKLQTLTSPLIMGIINVTPDSFYPESRRNSAAAAVEAARKMIADGADILDVGACSTRPGSEPISADEEISRLREMMPAIKETAGDRLISIDTFRSEVARECIEKWDVDIINDVSGCADERMAEVVADAGVVYVLMHTRGTPRDMQRHAAYRDVTAEVMSELLFKLDFLRERNVRDVIIDPGFGFAKNLDDNYRLLAELHEFKRLGCPILAGMSRKSMVCRLLGVKADDALSGTVVLNTVALMQGASILRVHDVKEASDVRKICGMLSRHGMNLHNDNMRRECIISR